MLVLAKNGPRVLFTEESFNGRSSSLTTAMLSRMISMHLSDRWKKDSSDSKVLEFTCLLFQTLKHGGYC